MLAADFIRRCSSGVEQRIRNAWVGGSNPLNGTSFCINPTSPDLVKPYEAAFCLCLVGSIRDSSFLNWPVIIKVLVGSALSVGGPVKPLRLRYPDASRRMAGGGGRVQASASKSIPHRAVAPATTCSIKQSCFDFYNLACLNLIFLMSLSVTFPVIRYRPFKNSVGGCVDKGGIRRGKNTALRG